MKKLIVFTDLDGTLLDHHDYQWQAAQPAIEKLHNLGYPLILNSSKTYAEMLQISEQLNNHHPFIFENGSSIAVPVEYFERQKQSDSSIINFGKNYQDILKVLGELRHKYQFIGFNDASVDDIMQMTNLDREKAILAKQRHSSEPIKWLGTDAELKQFTSQLQQANLSLIKGGRFYNVMGQCSKGEALSWLLEKYKQEEPNTNWITVALGDSQNDIPMLASVDYPVLINNPNTRQPDSGNLKNLLKPVQPGPEGWNKAVHQLIDLIQ